MENSPFTSSSATNSSQAFSVSLEKAPDLGNMVARHPGAFISLFVFAAFLGIMGVFGFLESLPKSDMTGIALGVVFTAGALVLIWFGVMRIKSCAYCYDDGLVLERGKKKQVVRWSEIESASQEITKHYYNGIPTHTSYLYTLILKDGQKVKVTGQYKKMEPLGACIQENVARLLLPGIIASFNAGQPVEFGDLKFDQSGITRGKTSIPWADFKYIDFSNGFLRVHKTKEGIKDKLTGGVITIQVSRLPNFYALMGFLETLPSYQAGQR